MKKLLAALCPNFLIALGFIMIIGSANTVAAEDLLSDNEGVNLLYGGSSILQRTRVENARRILKINAADWQDVMSLYTDDFEYQDPTLSVKPLTVYYDYIERVMATSPDLELIIEDELIMGNLYSATWYWTGLWGDVPYTVKGMSIVKFRDGEELAYYQKDYFTEGDIWVNIPEVSPIIQMLRAAYIAQVMP